MTPGPRHWAAAVAISVVGHLAVLGFTGRAPEAPALEGAPGTAEIWGLPVESISETAEEFDAASAPETPSPDAAEAETEVAREPPVVEADAIEADTAEAVETVAEVEPAHETAEAESPDAVRPTMAGEPVVSAAETREPDIAEDVEQGEPARPTEPETAEATDVTVPLPRARPAGMARRDEPAPARREEAARPAPQQPARPPAPAERSTSAPAGQPTGDAAQRASDGGRQAATNYAGRIVAHLNRYKRYPREAARERASGTATLTFTVGADGRVSGARLRGGSGHPALDREAAEMIRRASPFPPIPPAVGRSSMTFTVPIRFAPR